MTAKQKAARENFKKAVTDAQKLRKQNPKLTQSQALKAAFSKNKKVGAVKKSAPKKATPKKNAIVKKVIAKKSALKKKAALKKVTGSHKDTKSHNVNIRVVSGIVKAKPSVIILSKKIQKLTDLNLHNESVLALAKFLKEKKSIVLIQSVMKMMFSYGYMTNELTQIKRQILSELLKKFKNMYGEVDYKIIYDSF